MNVVVTVGDVLDASADVLFSTANPWINMSGGVNGAIRDAHPTFNRNSAIIRSPPTGGSWPPTATQTLAGPKNPNSPGQDNTRRHVLHSQLHLQNRLN
ncbi:hypothetical protein SAMN06265222_11630 [Neorhodopirellula lusitana]|uniref:Macro domain-containing protein n=1 Tax=Neorhodopirellula lusitana TaxID=445327 RepID=A0ABY1QJ93_9BACT|nr:hypothetical protein [Neorhodopirellula lusitana]SMP73136.1 hypothetical protein SAMN06265222_11630 [Neorhodopirellula lusitana]